MGQKPDNQKRVLEDLNARINPEKSRHFSPATFLETREILHSLADRNEFRSSGERVSVVGTNGKGSTAFYLSALVDRDAHSGECLSTGLYTSPHLHSLLERIRIDRKPVGFSALAREMDLLSSILGDELYKRFTFFEILTLLAIRIFKRRFCEVEIYEAGLGGRLDATRMVRASSVVLTTLSLDHTELLGSELSSIAREKLEIMGPWTDRLFFPPQNGISVESIEAMARQIRPGLEIHFFDDHFDPRRESYLNYNRRYARFVLESIEKTRGPAQKKLPEDFSPPGRLEKYESGERTFVFDTAHNAEAVATLCESLPLLEGFPGKDRVLILLGVLMDREPTVLYHLFLERGFQNTFLLEAEWLKKEPGLPSLQETRIRENPESFGHPWIVVAGSHRNYEFFLQLGDRIRHTSNPVKKK